ncbi:MAG: N-acetylglucosamine transferase [Caulobacterales bacterium]
MTDNIVLATLQRITAGELTLAELINVADGLRDAGTPTSAEQVYRVWIKFNPDHPQLYAAYYNCSTLPLPPDRQPAVKEALEQALALKPDFWPGYINLGGVLERAGELDEAVAQWKAVVDRLDQITGVAVSYKLTALKQISRVLMDHHRSAAAEAFLQQCLEIDPKQRDAIEQYIGLRLAQCRWPVVAPWEGTDRRTITAGFSPLSMATFTDDPMLQFASAVRYVEAAVDAGFADHSAERRHAPIDLKSRRLRVGYVSSDFRDHAIGYLMAELFELHDKSKIEVFAYYCGPPASGGLNDRYKAAIEHWADINDLSDDAAAGKIAADGVDILVDVNGHTRFARAGVFARRPAPIIVNWLGFPGTMGSPFHHYMVADDWIVPPDCELYYAEKVVRLPCYQPNDRKRAVAPERPTRAQAGLPEDAFVYCCFNGAQKIGRFTFQRWMEILERTPGSVLWLLTSDEETQARLADFAEGAGIARERLIFAPKLTNPHHLARYPLADLFLDTAPYGAHTTCSDALWMGVPVLTLSGRSFASRVCGSLVQAAGLKDLVFSTPKAFVDRAVELATNRGEIEAYKAALAAGRESCDLFNTAKLAARLEDLYRGMCEDYQSGKLPRPDLSNLDVYLQVGVEDDPEAVETMTLVDYQGHYKTKLARRHLMRPIRPDNRLWTAADIEVAEALAETDAPAATKAVA